MTEPRICVFVDDELEPITDYRPPAEVALDTARLADGEHRLRIEARDSTGGIAVRHVPFRVRNGPGITVSGFREGAIMHGTMRFMVNAFGAEEPFEPQRAELHAEIPVWVWVLSLVIVAWSAWYVATFWNAPPEFAKTPTFKTSMNPFR